jgi:hypothetical protein
MNYKPTRVLLSLHDKDGFKIGANTYKVLNGAHILLIVNDYPSISFNSSLNEDSRPSVILNTTEDFRSRIGPTGYAGYERPTLTLKAYLIIDDEVDSYENYFGAGSLTKYSSDSKVIMNFYMLFNMWMFNHRYYLKDINPDNAATSTDLGLPINILMNRKDMVGKDILTSDGIPVVIRSFKLGKSYFNFDDPTVDKNFIECTIEFAVD